MILCNREVHEALDAKRLIIDPDPQPRTPSLEDDAAYCPYDTHSVDLRLSNTITIPEEGTYAYDLTRPKPLATFLKKNSTSRDISESYVLKPNVFVLGMTLERISLPINHPINTATNTCLAARIEGKSSRARVGLLIHFTAPTVHPGWGEGRPDALTLEMINLGVVDIVLKPGMPIAQLIIEEVRGIPIPNPSQFHGQQTPEGTK